MMLSLPVSSATGAVLPAAQRDARLATLLRPKLHPVYEWLPPAGLQWYAPPSCSHPSSPFHPPSSLTTPLPPSHILLNHTLIPPLTHRPSSLTHPLTPPSHTLLLLPHTPSSSSLTPSSSSLTRPPPPPSHALLLLPHTPSSFLTRPPPPPSHAPSQILSVLSTSSPLLSLPPLNPLYRYGRV